MIDVSYVIWFFFLGPYFRVLAGGFPVVLRINSGF